MMAGVGDKGGRFDDAGAAPRGSLQEYTGLKIIGACWPPVTREPRLALTRRGARSPTPTVGVDPGCLPAITRTRKIFSGLPRLALLRQPTCGAEESSDIRHDGRKKPGQVPEGGPSCVRQLHGGSSRVECCCSAQIDVCLCHHLVSYCRGAL